MNRPQKVLNLLDIRGLMLKAYHGTEYKSLVSDSGTKIASWQEGLAEFVERTLVPMLVEAEASPVDILAVWDAGNTYRKGLFPQYKAKRLAQERDRVVSEELGKLKEKLRRLLAYLGIKSIWVPGEEADDLIALLATRAGADQVIVRTCDRDLTQLVSDTVSVWLDREFCSTQCAPMNGVPYSLVALWKALTGDSSDEYGGVPRLGEKTWQGLLAAYGPDGMLEIEQALRCNDPSPVQQGFDATGDKALKLVLDNWEQAKLCLTLATLAPEACYGSADGKRAKRPTWYARVPNREKVLQVLEEIGLSGHIALFEHLFPIHRLLTAEDHEALPGVMQEVLTSPVVSWDYESSDKLRHQPFREAKKRSGGSYVDVLSQEVAGVSINYGRHMEKTVYIPFDHAETPNFTMDWLGWILRCLSAVPERTVVQNASFELTVSLVNAGMAPTVPYDTKIMASYVDEEEDAGLKSLSLSFLGYRQTTYEEVTGGRLMCEIPAREVLDYGCDDSLVTSHLFVLMQTIMRCEGSWAFYAANEVEPALNDVLDFIDGTDIDFDLLAKLQVASNAKMEAAEASLRSLLAANATDRDPLETERRARILFEEWWQMIGIRMRGSTQEEELAKREEVWARAWTSCFYQPYVETVEVPDFVSTPTMLNKVLGVIDPEAPKIGKATGPGVEEFEAALQQYLGALNSTRRPASAGTLEEFMDVLYRARRKLGAASRSGAEYAALAEFCDRVLNGNPSAAGKVQVSGFELNTDSPPQMQGMLYGMMGLPIRKRSKVVHGSTRDEEDLDGAPATGLKAIAAAFVYDLPDQEEDWRKPALLAYRDLVVEQQRQSLYFKSYPMWRHPRDGRVHPSIRNCGTTTRRPAGSDPNVFQVSKKDGGEMRGVYKAGDYGDGPRMVVSCDFANQELVITACESRDPTMLDAFMSSPRKDLHSLTSTGFAHFLLPRMGVPWAGGKMDYETFLAGRKRKLQVGGLATEAAAKAFNSIRNVYAKPTNFLIVYGGGHTTLAGNLLIPKELAKLLMDSTFELYGRLEEWQQEVIEFALSHGYSQTAYGNRRHASPDLWSSDDYLRMHQERQLINSTIQGTAADILKEVRQEIVRRRMRERYRMRAVRPVYDEVTASIPLEAVPEYCQELVEVMCITPPGYPVGMACELSIGPTWGSQIEVDGVTEGAVLEVLRQLEERSGQ